ncbi:MAG: hypothetical protein J6T34_01330 [Bacilli bacterium]|nr:hypothetical protein [Bacilli bacterium]
MKKVYIVLLSLICLFIVGCKREAKSPEDYQAALESIKFDFDLDNITGDVSLPTKTKKYELEILWQLQVIESSADNYYPNCAALKLVDGITTITHKIEYDDNYDEVLFGKATLVASVFDDDNTYSKEFVITVYEKSPKLDLTVKQIKDYCNNQDTHYIESNLKIVWIKETKDNYYNLILTDDEGYIFVNDAYYNKRYNLKKGDMVHLIGFSGLYGYFPVVSSSEKNECTVELVEKGSYSYNAQEIAYSDFGKLKTTDSSVYLMLVKFDGIIKQANDGSDYSYYIEGVKSKELIVNISNYSFDHNSITNDRTAKRQISDVLGKEATIVGYILYNTNGVWELIIIPSETK